MVAAVQLAIIVGRAHSGDPVAQFQTAQAAAQICQAVDAFRQASVTSTLAAAAALRAKLDAEFAEYERLAAEGRHFEAGMALRTAGATLIEISTLGALAPARVLRARRAMLPLRVKSSNLYQSNLLCAQQHSA